MASGSVLEFKEGVGMLVQGELIRNDYYGGGNKKVIFTSSPFEYKGAANVRLVDEDGNDQVTEGRLEVCP